MNAFGRERIGTLFILIRPRAGCGPIWPLLTFRILFHCRTSLRCVHLISDAVRGTLEFGWRGWAFTSRYWILLRLCWTLPSVRELKQGRATKLGRHMAPLPNWLTCS